MSYIYFDVAYATRAHDKILEVSGGLPGVIDEGRLDSILEHIRNDDYLKSRWWMLILMQQKRLIV